MTVWLNVGSVTLTTNGSDIAVNSVIRGGLVGYLVKGVLRLHGKTDLSGWKITTAYNHGPDRWKQWQWTAVCHW